MKKKLNQKLQLKKSTIAKLSNDNLTNIKGGEITVISNANTVCPSIGCPTAGCHPVTYTCITCNDTCQFSKCLDTCACY